MAKFVCAASVVLLLTSCGGTAEHATPPPAKQPPRHAVARHCSTTAAVTIGSLERSFAAVVRRHAVVYRRPGGPVIAGYRKANRYGVPTVFAVRAMLRTRDCRPSWFHVQLPRRPNGASGWLRARAVWVVPVATHIVIHVRAKRLELFRAGRIVFRTPISTGAPDTPTPIGRFYVTERLKTGNPEGPWGPAALGTSAFSPVLKQWVQGGPIGIHGTDDPTAIGRPVSHGCIRLPNGAMKRLFALTPAGTPIVIKR
jgi:lipoprotein-anchoring transpeptidase ErfK/SrfK